MLERAATEAGLRHAEDAGPGPVSAPEGHGASPIKVGAAVLAVALGAWGLLWLTMRSEEPAGQPRDVEGGGVRLTDSEAIQRARELINLSEEAIEDRNPSLVSHAYTTDSPAAARVQSDIQKLRRDGVFDRGEVEIVQLEVITNTTQVIRVKETSILRPCFLTESGKDITTGPAAIEIVGTWTFHWQRENWLIYETSLDNDRAIDRKDASCA